MKPSKLWVLFALSGCSSELSAVDSIEPPTDAIDTDDTGFDTAQDTGDKPPVADAGPDQTGFVSEVFVLDATGSYDPDGGSLTYEWSFLAAPSQSTTTLINDTSTGPEFWADRDGVYRVELVVSNGIQSAVDDVQIVVEVPNDDPIANAGQDQSVDVGETVQLNGNNSYDPNNDPLSYTWEFVSRPSNSNASLGNAQTPFPQFVADASGPYVIRLTVNDGNAESAPDDVTITAQDPSDSDCISCSQAALHMQQQTTLGSQASAPGLLLLPLFALFYQRQRDE